MYKYNAKVINVVDGDTVDMMVDMGFNIWAKTRFRLRGINAPEKKTPTLEEGNKAMLYLSDLILGKDVYIESNGKDKYGRWLVTIFGVNEENIPLFISVNQMMIDAGMAVPYME